MRVRRYSERIFIRGASSDSSSVWNTGVDCAARDYGDLACERKAYVPAPDESNPQKPASKLHSSVYRASGGIFTA
jgi:hypothetical protein